ncbi:Uncharacterised protein [Legionella beliardensis]|uniref:Uncharacterized protein n=1 Tax=Legionella beliardensis TaxID=91822 RepID=A0A378HYS8_9GAMM|nr:hypothetical protein [Legionella beliardensis]STX27691.1 Uncharacterised protein [Legionella beliardensis]
MKQELINKLKKINPVDENGVPKNKGNCQWSAIEGARVLLEGVEPTEIPNVEPNATDPTNQVHDNHNSDYITSKDSGELFEKIKELKEGELLLVSLECDDIDHAYLIYKDDDGAHLVDPDRQIFVKLTQPKDFLQRVKGWDDIETLNYLNGKTNSISSSFKDKVKADVCFLNKAAVEFNPLPKYGSEEPTSRYQSTM